MDLQVRPIYHWKDDRIKSHVFWFLRQNPPRIAKKVRVSQPRQGVHEKLVERGSIQVSYSTLLRQVEHVVWQEGGKAHFA